MTRRFYSRVALAAAAVGAVAGPGSVRAQPPPHPPSSVESVRTALQSPRPGTALHLPAIDLAPPPPRRLGVLTIVPPDTNGQFVNVSLPVAELAMRAARAVAAARYRRGEGRARDEVRRTRAA